MVDLIMQGDTRMIVPKPALAHLSDKEESDSVFGPLGNTIPVLQERGVVFLACHNAIWELVAQLIASDKNPDHLSHAVLAAELANHLTDEVVLTPGIAATIPELQQVGFHYVAWRNSKCNGPLSHYCRDAPA